MKNHIGVQSSCTIKILEHCRFDYSDIRVGVWVCVCLEVGNVWENKLEKTEQKRQNGTFIKSYSPQCLLQTHGTLYMD